MTTTDVDWSIYCECEKCCSVHLKGETDPKVKNQPPDLTAGEFNRGE